MQYLKEVFSLCRVKKEIIEISFEVSGTEVGIPDEETSNLFKPF